ncbi:hypothetical protein [Empedobacter sedimenti]|uniref:hypothetical protein n=1 Tax=Empedobacter sedimenti TaxID=3042610 RepID=UPI0024A6BDDA|nr:hypothetical protein [Empedobacter sedimenti]
MPSIYLPNTDQDFIKKLIPQREPIIMVDAIFEYQENKVVGGLTIFEDCIFVENNILQESGILEHMAQTVALYTGYDYFIKNMQAPVGYIGSMKNVEIFHLPQTNETLITTVHILHEIMDVTLVNIVSKIGEKIIASGEMKTVIAE